MKESFELEANQYEIYAKAPPKVRKRREILAQKALGSLWKNEFFLEIREKLTPVRSGFFDFVEMLALIHACLNVGLVVKDSDGKPIILAPKSPIPRGVKEALATVFKGVTSSAGLPGDIFFFHVTAQALLWPDEIRKVQDLNLLTLYGGLMDEDNPKLRQRWTSQEATKEEKREAEKFLTFLHKELGTPPLIKVGWGVLSGKRKKLDNKAIKLAAEYEKLKKEKKHRNQYDRYNFLAKKYNCSWEEIEREISRGRKLKESSND